MSLIVHKSVAGLMALAVVLTALPATGVRHSHSGGEQAHSHGGHAHHEHAEHDHSQQDSEILTDNTVHAHTSWLGFDLGRQRDDEDEKKSDPQESLFVVQFIEQAVTHSVVCCTFWPDLAQVDCLVWKAAVDDRHGQLFYRTEAAPPTPLCDAARHERSGVQLF